MEQIQTSVLEKYVLGQLEEIKRTAKYEENNQFLLLLDQIKNNTEITQDLEERVNSFRNNKHVNHQLKEILKYFLQEKKFRSSNEEEKVKIMQRINEDLLNFHFDYEKQNGGVQLIEDEQNQQQTPSEILGEIEKEFMFKNFLEKIYEQKSESLLDELKNEYYLNLDLERFDFEKDWKLCFKIVQNQNPNVAFLIKGFEKFLVFLQSKTHENNVKNYLTNFLQDENLSLDLIKRLLDTETFKSDHILLQNYFNQTFSETLTNNKVEEIQLDQCYKAKEFLQKNGLVEQIGDKFLQLLKKMLIVSSEKNKYDLNLWQDYLNALSNQYHRQTLQIVHIVQCQDEHKGEEQYVFYVIRKYLQDNHNSKIDSDGTISMPKFENIKLFQDEKLKKLVNLDQKVAKFYQDQLEKGNQQDEVLSYFNKEQIQQFLKVKKLEIIDSKEHYGSNEKLELTLKIKNIKKILIDVYEVDTVKYLKQESVSNYIAMDLTGLKPSIQEVHQFDESSLEITEKVFAFEKIDQRNRGVFIIDFKGENLQSRACISKGEFNVVFKEMEKKLIVMNEQNQVLTDVSVYFKKSKLTYQSNDEGFIDVSKEKTNGLNDILIIQDNFAQSMNINLNSNSNYSLDIALFLNPESVQQKKVLKFFISSLLKNNEQKVSLKNLKNTFLYVQVQNKDNITKTFKFQDLDLVDGEDYPVEIVLPSFVQNVIVELTGSVFIEGEKLERALSAKQRVDLRGIERGQTSNVYLTKNEQNEYIVNYLGLNGEVLPNKNLQVYINNRYHNQQISYTLKTDQRGKINLKQLRDVQTIVIRQEQGIESYFQISKNLKSEIIYRQNRIQVHKNEQIVLPKQEDEQWNLFKRVKDDQLILSNQLLQQDQEIKLESLDVGNYQLLNSFNKETIEIKVVDSKQSQIEDFYIVEDNIEQKQEYKFLSYDKNDDSIVINSQGFKDIRAYLIDSNYLTDIESFIDYCGFSLMKNSNRQEFYQIIKLKQDCKYVSEKQLNYELLYCQERKNQNQYLTNNLEKPSMLIKRERTTAAHDDNVLIQQPQYDNQFAQQCYAKNACARMGRGLKEKRRGPSYQPLTNQFVELDHLKNHGKVTLLEIKDNKIIIDKKSQLNNIRVLLLADDQQKLIDVSNKDDVVEKIDVRLQDSISKNFINHNKYECVYLNEGDKKEYQNFKNTDMLVIGDTENFATILELLSNDSNFSVKNKVLWNWLNMNYSQKLSEYNEFYCNELNLMIFLKDKEFYQRHVKEVVQDKIEKTLIDYYILGDVDKLQEYCQFFNIKELSKLELVLLFSVIKETNKVFADQVLTYFRNNSKRWIIPENVKETLFDAILNCQNENVDKNKIREASQQLSQIYQQDVHILYEVENNACQMRFTDVRCDEMDYQRQQSFEECEDEGITPPSRIQMFGGAMKMSRAPMLQGHHRQEVVDRERRQRKEQEQLEESQGKTYAYKETQYSFQPTKTTIVEQFWTDLLEHVNQTGSFNGFFSQNFIFNNQCHQNTIMNLIFTDLPNRYTECKNNVEGDNFHLEAQSKCFIISKQLIQEKGEKITGSVSLIQRFYDPNDETFYDEETNETYDKNLSEFIKQKIYTSKIIVTNFSQKEISLKLMYQIPQGSIPINSHKITNFTNITLPSFATKSFLYDFYFPEAGNFTIYPATLFKEKKILAISEVPSELEVLEQHQIQEAFTLNDVLSTGSIDEILNFIRNRNILNKKTFDMQGVYWLLKNKKFYTELLNIMKIQGVYDEVVWSFSIYHKDIETFEELLTETSVNKSMKSYLKDLLGYEQPYNIIEFYPLQNSRAHSIQENQTNIINQYFQKHYNKFLIKLALQDNIEEQEKLLLVEYLLCQDRIDEAIRLFDKIDQKQIEGKVQLAYIQVFLKFMKGPQFFEELKDICDEYVEYPLTHWRNRFIEVVNLISEYEEQELIQQDINKTVQKNKPDLEIEFKAELKDQNVFLTFSKEEEIIVDFYEVDLEVMFSIDPFSKNLQGKQLYVTSNYQQKVKLDGNGQVKNQLIHLGEYANKNCVIEVIRKNGETITLKNTPFNFVYLLNKEKGQIKIFDPIKKIPLGRVYIKTFAQNDQNKVIFFKDGYTDIRGQFDYGVLSLNQKNQIKQFSLLIMTQENGSKVIQCDPPANFQQPRVEQIQIRSQNYQLNRNMKKR